jgi:hypothetical protein
MTLAIDIDTVVYATGDKLLGGPHNTIGSEVDLQRLRRMTICMVILKNEGFAFGINVSAEGDTEAGRKMAYGAALSHIKGG